jgi:hypothetical protein
MTLADLIARYRSDSTDTAIPYLCTDEEVTGFLNEGEEEAALRANLIFDATTADVCVIAVTAGTAVYPLHESVFQVTKATFTPTGDTCPIPLGLSDRVEQDRIRPNWRTTSEPPQVLIVDDTSVQIACLPDTDGTLNLEVYRAPLTLMAATDDVPEIGRAHHRHLVLWALYRAYIKPDTEINDPGRAGKALAEFTRQFGERPDAAMRRDFQANAPAANKGWW